MSLIMILDNVVERSEITSQHASANFSAVNIQNNYKAQVFRSNYVTDTPQTSGYVVIRGNLSQYEYLSGLVIANHNLSTDGVYGIKLYQAHNWGTLIYDSGPISLSGTIPGFGDLYWGDTPWAYIPTRLSTHWFNAYKAGSWELYFKDTSANTDGYIEVGKVFLGLTISPKYKFAPGSAIGFTDDANQVRAASGALWAEQNKKPYKTMSLRFSVTDREDASVLMAQFRNCGKRRDIFISGMDDEELTKRNDYMIIGKLTKIPVFTEFAQDYYSFGLDIEES